MKTSYPLLLVSVFLVSFLDPISANHVICLSNMNVDEACEEETFSIHDKFEKIMEAEWTILQQGNKRNLLSDDKRELQSPSNCAYCQKYQCRWCEEYPYVNCNRILDTNPHTMTEAQCVKMVSTAEEKFNTLQKEASQKCGEALQSIQCSCNTD
jgi:hypothetical protein